MRHQFQPDSLGNSGAKQPSLVAAGQALPPPSPGRPAHLALLHKKGLSENLFLGQLTLADGIADHAAFLYQTIYSCPYKRRVRGSEFPRPHHGIAHVSRVAFYIPVIANLFARYQDVVMSEEDIRLLQLAALFHDAGREGDGVDLWDKDSAELLYYYLTLTLKIPAEKASIFAEAIANKDYVPNGIYHTLTLAGDKIIWESRPEAKEKNILQIILHDADCLDVIRARDVFDGTYLDFYKIIAAHKAQAFDEMVKVICEARSLIALQGDARHFHETVLKREFDTEVCYAQVQSLVDSYSQFLILRALHTPTLRLDKPILLNPRPFIADPAHPDYLSAMNLGAASATGQLIVRCIGAPSAHLATQPEGKKLRFPNGESRAALELRKMLRRPDGDGRGKNGNLGRSVSIVTAGANIFSMSGFFILNIPLHHILSVKPADSNSGHGKKKHCRKIVDEDNVAHRASVLAEWDNTIRQMKLGGSGFAYTLRDEKRYSTHSEMIAHLYSVDGILYTLDTTLFNACISKETPLPYHAKTPFLEALYLSGQYRASVATLPDLACYAEMKRRVLPVFEYQGQHDTIKLINTPNDDEILEIWQEVINDFFKKQFDRDQFKFLSCDINVLKAMMCYDVHLIQYDSGSLLINPLDEHYSSELKARIDLIISLEINKKREAIESSIRDKLCNASVPLSQISKEAFSYALSSSNLETVLRQRMMCVVRLLDTPDYLAELAKEYKPNYHSEKSFFDERPVWYLLEFTKAKNDIVLCEKIKSIHIPFIKMQFQNTINLPEMHLLSIRHLENILKEVSLFDGEIEKETIVFALNRFLDIAAVQNYYPFNSLLVYWRITEKYCPEHITQRKETLEKVLLVELGSRGFAIIQEIDLLGHFLKNECFFEKAMRVVCKKNSNPILFSYDLECTEKVYFPDGFSARQKEIIDAICREAEERDTPPSPLVAGSPAALFNRSACATIALPLGSSTATAAPVLQPPA